MESLGCSSQRRTESTLVLPHITQLTVFNARGVDRFLPQWAGALFPNLETFLFCELEGIEFDQTRVVRRMSEACPSLVNVSFSENVPARPVTEWIGGNK